MYLLMCRSLSWSMEVCNHTRDWALKQIDGVGHTVQWWAVRILNTLPARCPFMCSPNWDFWYWPVLLGSCFQTALCQEGSCFWKFYKCSAIFFWFETESQSTYCVILNIIITLSIMKISLFHVFRMQRTELSSHVLITEQGQFCGMLWTREQKQILVDRCDHESTLKSSLISLTISHGCKPVLKQPYIRDAPEMTALFLWGNAVNFAGSSSEQPKCCWTTLVSTIMLLHSWAFDCRYYKVQTLL